MKQQLTEALAWYADMTYLDEKDAPMVAAARLVERLLPGECETCAGEGVAPVRLWPARVPVDCPDCHGSGQVWDEGIVEVVAKAIFDDNSMYKKPDQLARAVLSALVELLTEKVK